MVKERTSRLKCDKFIILFFILFSFHFSQLIAGMGAAIMAPAGRAKR